MDTILFFDIYIQYYERLLHNNGHSKKKNNHQINELNTNCSHWMHTLRNKIKLWYYRGPAGCCVKNTDRAFAEDARHCRPTQARIRCFSGMLVYAIRTEFLHYDSYRYHIVIYTRKSRNNHGFMMKSTSVYVYSGGSCDLKHETVFGIKTK